MHDDRPLVALTMGDVAGVGPEVIARAWGESPLRSLARPMVVGSRAVLERALRQVGSKVSIQAITDPAQADPTGHVIPCLDPTGDDLADVRPGQVSARAGRAAYDYLIVATDLALAGRVDAITTLPLNKESLRAGGIEHPGHTEILAERCGATEHAMMLYLDHPGGGEWGLGVLHATLFRLLTVDRVAAKIRLADEAMPPLTGGRPPRIAVAGLNPHAGENGLFGDEEIRIIGPAVEQARAEGVDVVGPFAADTLFVRALNGEFDAVIAMYHDQGHVALKSIGFERAVNVTLGLPIVRTSVAHGTAFDIAWTGKAETSSLIEATRVAARIVAGQKTLGMTVAGSR
jgi:4-hydroxythreonine-4-phosphate dehydrogenase